MALPDPISAKQQVQSVQSVGDTDAMGGAAIGGELRFERFQLLAHDVAAGGEDASGGFIQFVLQLCVSCLQVEERNFHLADLTASRKSSCRRK